MNRCFSWCGGQVMSALVFGLLLTFVGGLTGVAHADQSVGGVERDDTGRVKGVIKFEGRQARRPPLRMSDRYCLEQHDGPALQEMFIFGKDDTLQNVFVYISSGLEGKRIPTVEQALVVDQVGCVYTPHVAGAIVNQQVQIRNSDNTLHNVNCQARVNERFNIGQPVKGMVHNVRFSRPEMEVQLKCDVHPWMQAYVHVMPHPFFAVTGENGTFEIQGLEPGEYEIKVWHEFPRFAPDRESATVTVVAGEAAEVVFTYAPRAAAGQ